MEESQDGEDFEEADKQVENSKVPPQLRPWQFKPGQSGNPGGRPKGTISLKEFAKRYLQELDDEGKIEFMAGLDKDTVWKMAEGNPKNDVDLNAKVTIADVLKDIEHAQITGQIVADTELIQDTGQEEKLGDIPQEQSPATLPAEQVVEKYYSEESAAGFHD